MALLTNFPLDYDDQINVIEIFDGLMRSMEAAPRRPISSLPDLQDPGFQRRSPDPSE
jgi:hypothetical protein